MVYLQYLHILWGFLTNMFTIPSYFVGFSYWSVCNTFIFCKVLLLACLQYFHHSEGLLISLILNVIIVRALVASHESDQVELPPNHVMEYVDWVHEQSRWKCKINGCTNTYVVKWLFHRHLDNKHRLRIEVGKYGCPSTHVGEPRQQNHHVMNV